MLKKALSIVLALLLLVSVMPMAVYADDSAGDEQEVFTEIKTVEDLYMVNLDLAGNYKLMNDIDLTEATAKGGDWDFDGRGWDPIGGDGVLGSTEFTGTFDGNGYKISGMRIDVNSIPGGVSRAHVGLFANNKGTIKNLTLSGKITSAAKAYYVGTIAAYNSGTIESCISKVELTNVASEYVGGITGYNSGTVEACKHDTSVTKVNSSYLGGISGNNTGTITGCEISVSFSDISSNYVGGIAGNAGSVNSIINSSKTDIEYKSINATYIGGVAGTTSGGKIELCENSGSITDAIGTYFGGIAGYLGSATQITNCRNTADISLKHNTYSSCYAGGIAGGSSKQSKIKQCYNTGNISASNQYNYYNVYSYSSGIACGTAAITDCYNTGNITASAAYGSSNATSSGIISFVGETDAVSNCYNTGTAKYAITASSGAAVTNCYFLSGSGAYVTGTKALTAAQMKLKVLYVGFDFDNVWFIDNTGEYPYPQLIENAAYPADSHVHTPAEAVRENEKPATCKEEGSYDEVVYCSECGEELSRETKVIGKINHTPAEPVVENEKPATCKEEGSYDEVIYCSVCGDELQRLTYTVEKAEHTPAEAVRENEKPATCKEEGSYDEVIYCSECGEEISRETKTIEKAAHDLKLIEEVPATETSYGIMAHYECKVCGKLFFDATGTIEVTMVDLIIPKLTPTEPATDAPTETVAPTEPATEAAPTETTAPTEPATEAAPTETTASTEQVTEVPTQEPTTVETAVVTVFNGNNAETKILNVGDTFTVYTTLNTKNIDSGKISTVTGTQTYTSGVLSVNEELDDELLIADTDKVFPILKNRAIGNCAEAGKVYFSGSTPSATKNPFIFNSDSSILIALNYKVEASGMAMVTTSLQTLAMTDVDLTRIVDKGVTINPNFSMITTFNKPESTGYYLGDADGNEEVDAVDATVILRYATRVKVNYPEEILMHGDVDGDGDLSVVDATYIQRYSTRVKVPYDVGKMK